MTLHAKQVVPMLAHEIEAKCFFTSLYVSHSQNHDLGREHRVRAIVCHVGLGNIRDGFVLARIFFGQGRTI